MAETQNPQHNEFLKELEHITRERLLAPFLQQHRRHTFYLFIALFLILFFVGWGVWQLWEG